MKHFRRVLYVLGVALALTTSAKAPDPARSAELFDQAAAELDLRGDMLVYFQIEGLVEGLLGKIKDVAGRIAEREDSAAAAVDIVGRIDSFLRTQGLYDGVSIGISSRPRPDGYYDVKSFIARKPADPAPLFWRMMGGAPRELRVLDLIPADAAVVLSADFRPADVWAFLQAAVQEVGGEQPYGELRAAVEELKTTAGADLDALIASLGGEVAFSLQLSRDRTVELPLDSQRLAVPVPSFLLALGVKDDSLLQLLLAQIREGDLALETRQADGQTTYVAPVVTEEPFPIQIALAQHENYLLVASHPDVMAESLKAFQSGKGLKSEPGFQAITKDLPTLHNGLIFVDERFRTTVYEIQMTALREEMPDEEAELAVEVMNQLFGWSKEGSLASVRVVKPNGILTHAVTPTGGKEVALAGAAMPIGLLAAVAVPSFVKARSRAQEAQMINVVRMVDAAKQQWALENSKEDGADVTEDDIAPYLPAGILDLPPGHTLHINPLGEDPTITRPDGSTVTL
ncbi:MAG TPA: DUF3352 domain-containing protein [Kiritimatiellia bacterium]|nr:DUF3352 domain-containing protein [Kiritimatiellia bacterium]HRZ11369.1 DUF3352 domain-containing protein [Kiritimatiellia bacterium]HSA17080.1 DUF3352 domain-containing protein [Kiritimatiellia bacterium]